MVGCLRGAGRRSGTIGWHVGAQVRGQARRRADAGLRGRTLCIARPMPMAAMPRKAPHRTRCGRAGGDRRCCRLQARHGSRSRRGVPRKNGATTVTGPVVLRVVTKCRAKGPPCRPVPTAPANPRRNLTANSTCDVREKGRERGLSVGAGRLNTPGRAGSAAGTGRSRSSAWAVPAPRARRRRSSPSGRRSLRGTRPSSPGASRAWR